MRVLPQLMILFSVGCHSSLGPDEYRIVSYKTISAGGSNQCQIILENKKSRIHASGDVYCDVNIDEVFVKLKYVNAVELKNGPGSRNTYFITSEELKK
jgi:hypothetical protein